MARARHHTGAAALVAIAPSAPIAHLAVQHCKSKETMKKLKCERCERERESWRGCRGVEDNENYLNIYSILYVCRIRVYNRVIISSLITSTIAGSGRLAANKMLHTFKRQCLLWARLALPAKKCCLLSSGNLKLQVHLRLHLRSVKKCCILSSGSLNCEIHLRFSWLFP